MEEQIALNNEQTTLQGQQKPKLTKKTLLKKTILSPSINGNENIEPIEDINPKKNYYLKDDKTKIIKKKKINKAEFLIKTIMKAFYLSIWKKKVKSLRYYTRRPNPNRVKFKNLITQISSAIKQHKFDYFNEICENMDSLPMPKNIKHDIY